MTETQYGLPWQDGRMLALDVETTGTDPETARIVAAAVVAVGGGAPAETTTWLLDPGIEIPVEATAVHHITTEQAQADGRPVVDALPEIAAAVTGPRGQWRVPLVVFRAPYALTVLARECARHDIDFPADQAAPVIDPYVIDKHLDRYRRGRRTLPELCRHYQVRHDGPNDAAHDAMAAARLAWRLPRAFPDLAATALPDLHQRQIAWAAEQAAGLQEHKRRTDPSAHVNGEWPMVPGRPAHEAP
ncbi:exonuclease domain-containing protein [Streptomyces sp. NPDC052496]|uniref:exonuclease domain-containing protein n=1 Tax=Streptomyces sp. NPDC052496 TaxID=3154951 RepID=UPI003429B518